MRRYMEPRYVSYLRTRHIRSGKAYLPRFVILVRFAAFVLCFFVFICSAAVKFYKALENTGNEKAVQLVNECINNSILSASAKYPADGFLKVEKTNKGGVAAIETSAVNINSYIAYVCDNINDEISKKQNQKIKIPIHEIAGRSILVPSNLSIPIRIEPVGEVLIEPESVFEYNEMNKTVHRLNMKVNIKIKILFPI
ncbi:MAG TPA: sporulation protein YunB, partial [Clostridia bacterium]